MTSGRVWIWGRHPVLEALRSGTARTILLSSGRERSPILDQIRARASEAGIPVTEVSASDVNRLASGANTQGVAAEIDLPKVNGVGELIRATEHAPGAPFLLALDRVQDPHNLGALLRTAEAAGVAGMIVPQSRSAALTGTVVKTSAGAAARVPVLSVPNLVRTLDEVKRAGVWTAGLDGDADQTVFEADLTVPLLLVVGGEGEGLRQLTRERCDLLLRLPMAGSIASLNASVAGAIAMYEVVRQRLYASRSSA